MDKELISDPLGGLLTMLLYGAAMGALIVGALWWAFG
jgi:hypothetical protein